MSIKTIILSFTFLLILMVTTGVDAFAQSIDLKPVPEECRYVDIYKVLNETVDMEKQKRIEEVAKFERQERARIAAEIEKKRKAREAKLRRSRQTPQTYGYSEHDVKLLAHLINAEAKGESFEGMIAVGNIVINRTKSDEFPDTIEGVIYQPKQFQPVSNGAINEQPSKEAFRAARESLRVNVVGNALFFYNPYTATDSWIRTRQVIKTIGNHSFTL